MYFVWEHKWMECRKVCRKLLPHFVEIVKIRSQIRWAQTRSSVQFWIEWLMLKCWERERGFLYSFVHFDAVSNQIISSIMYKIRMNTCCCLLLAATAKIKWPFICSFICLKSIKDFRFHIHQKWNRCKRSPLKIQMNKMNIVDDSLQCTTVNVFSTVSISFKWKLFYFFGLGSCNQLGEDEKWKYKKKFDKFFETFLDFKVLPCQQKKKTASQNKVKANRSWISISDVRCSECIVYSQCSITEVTTIWEHGAWNHGNFSLPLFFATIRSDYSILVWIRAYGK